MKMLEIYFLSLFQVHSTLLLTIVTMTYIGSSEHIYLMTKFIPLDQHLPIFCILSPWQPLFNYVFMIWLFFLIPHRMKHIIFVLVWLILLSVKPSRFIHVVINGRISFFFKGIMYIYLFLYPFIHPQTLRLFLSLSWCFTIHWPLVRGLLNSIYQTELKAGGRRNRKEQMV